MADTIRFVDVGEGIHEGKLVKWHVKIGDLLSEDQIMADVETDKAVVELPCSKTGTVLALHVKEGQTVHVGEPMLTVGKPGETFTLSIKPALQSSAPSASFISASTKAISIPSAFAKPLGSASLDLSASPKPFATDFSFESNASLNAPPSVRKKALELGVDLLSVSGSGKGGRITEDDVLAAAGKPLSFSVQNVSVLPSLVPPGSSGQLKATPRVRKLANELGVNLEKVAPDANGHVTEEAVRAAASVQHLAVPEILLSSVGGITPSHTPIPCRPELQERIALQSVRKKIAERMVESAAIPQLTHVDEADVTALWKMREKQKGFAQKKGVKLTLLPFVVKATVKALQEFPHFNALLDTEKMELVLHKFYDVGIAVDTPAGLMVPVLREADKKTVFEIARDIQMISEKTRERKASVSELSGSTFTINNIGSAGGVYATPLINPPEAAILGVMRMQTRPAFSPVSPLKKPAKNAKLKVEARQFLPLCLSFDHRMVDGADAALFVKEIKKHLENPEGLLVDVV
jgi:pyruvate dehydrogenase E2 component (dihydrolipoamide acetyltransferase)